MNRTIWTVTLIACCSVCTPCSLPAGALAPSADPAATFIATADSIARAESAPGLSLFVRDNSVLVGAAVATLLDAAFLAARDGNPAGEKENVDFANKVARMHEAGGGTATPRSLVDAYRKWTASQRKTRQKAMDLEAESATARKAGDLARAISLLDEARALYEKIGDRHSVAVNWGSMGVARWGTGEWDAVLSDYGHALEARRAVEDRILEGRTLNALGSTYLEKGDNAQSIDFYRQAIELRRKTGDAVGLGTSLTYLGNAYLRTRRLVEARTQYEEAIPILESLGRADQMVDLHVGLANLASEMGRMQDANRQYLLAIELSSANQLVSKEAVARQNLAINCRLQGRFADALAQLDAAEKLLTTNASPELLATLHRDRGLTCMEMGDIDRARDELLACAALAKGVDDPLHAIEAEINIGYLYLTMGATEHGLKAAARAVELAEAAQHARGYRDALALRAELQRMAGRPADALATWDEALAQDEADHATFAILQDKLGSASSLAMLGEGAQARARLRSILPEAREDGSETLVVSILFGIGHSFEGENADSAAACYAAALQTMESTAGRAGSGEARATFLSGQRRYYYEEIARFYAATHASTGDARWSELAFETIERAKARGLLDMLQAQVAGSTSPEEAAALDALYSLDPGAADYAAQKSNMETRYEQLRDARLREAMGGLAGGEDLAGLPSLATGLPKNAVMVAYALGDTASLAWVIDRSGSEMRMLPPRAEMTSEIRRFRDALALVDKGRPALLESSRALYRMLLEPFEQRLEHAKSIVIVPDGALFELPFEALLADDAKPDAGWRKQPFLARRAPILYAPSATVYLSLRSAAPSSTFAHELLAIGNPDFAGLDRGTESPLSPLPYAQQEVETIGAKLASGRKVVHTGTDAREKTLKLELQNGGPRVLHLATHGLVDPVEPGRSSVALAPGDGEDGYFYTLEILAQRVPSRLVVMSACESARGQISRGEGVVGLSRAFLASGAGSVVASLWPVSDESTALLMKTFYDKMFGGKNPASRALNEARLALLKDEKYSHPFFWSPFIVTGTEQAPW